MCARAKHMENRSRSVWDIENNTWARGDMEFQLYLSLVLNRASDVIAAEWLCQTHVKNYRNFSLLVIPFFSLVEIPTNHSSVCYNKFQYK